MTFSGYEPVRLKITIDSGVEQAKQFNFLVVDFHIGEKQTYKTNWPEQYKNLKNKVRKDIVITFYKL